MSRKSRPSKASRPNLLQREAARIMDDPEYPQTPRPALGEVFAFVCANRSFSGRKKLSRLIWLSPDNLPAAHKHLDFAAPTGWQLVDHLAHLAVALEVIRQASARPLFGPSGLARFQAYLGSMDRDSRFLPYIDESGAADEPPYPEATSVDLWASLGSGMVLVVYAGDTLGEYRRMIVIKEDSVDQEPHILEARRRLAGRAQQSPVVAQLFADAPNLNPFK